MIVTDATHLPRIMVCGGSIDLNSEVPASSDSGAGTREEGIAAHFLAKMAFDRQLNPGNFIGQQMPNGIFVTDEMAEHVGEYLDLIYIRRMPRDLLEYSASFGNENFRVDTRADCISSDGVTLRLLDFKYGYRFVEPEENYTMLAQAIAFEIRDKTEHDNYEFAIYQPRGFNHPEGPVRFWQITRHELLHYFEKITSRLSNLPTDLVTSKHCYRCPALTTCRASKLAGMNAVDVSQTFFDDTISNEALAFELDMFARAMEVLKEKTDALQDLAKHRIKSGQIIENYILEIGKGNRAFHKHLTPELLSVLTGKDLTEKKTVTPAKAIRMGISEIVIDALSERPSTGVKLVRRDVNKQATKALKERG